MDEAVSDEYLTEQHIARIRNNNQECTGQFHCETCGTIISHEQSVRPHCKTIKHHEIIQRCKQGVDLFLEAYHKDCVIYSLEYMLHDRGMKAEDHEKRLEIVQELEFKLQTQLPELEGMSLQLYGSSTFQMGTQDSDANCFMMTKDYPKAVGRVLECLKVDDQYDNIKTIPAPKNPRISLTHVETGLVILINNYSERSENLGELMKLYAMVDPRIVKLAQLLKLHAKELNLAVNNIFANHVFYLMTVYFCQRVSKPLLPCPNIDYGNVMGRKEEEEMRKHKAAKPLVKEESYDTLHMFAGNLVLNTLQQALVISCLEDEVAVSMDSISSTVDSVRAKLCPEPCAEKNPWNAGSTAESSASEPSVILETKPGGLPEDEVNWGNIPEYESVEQKVSLNEWGQTFLAAVRQQVLEYTVENTDPLSTLWLKMLRFYAKFNFANRIVSIRQLSDVPVSEKDMGWSKSTCMIEDPFQPWVMLYNEVNKGGKKKRRGHKGGFEMSSHLKHTFRLMQHYYEAPHKKALCLGKSSREGSPDTPFSSYALEPPFSFYELAIRYEVPTAILDLYNVPLQQMLPPLSNVGTDATDALHTIIHKIMALYSMQPHHAQERQDTFDAMRQLIKDNVSKDAEPVWFGSSRNGLGLNTSDLDITLKLKNPNQDPIPLLRTLANSIKNDSKKFVFVDIVEMCRVPIVKFSCVHTDLTGDIAVGNMLAIRNTELLKTYTEIDARVRELGYFIKIVMKECECADASTGSLSSYGYSMMVIYFLQQVDPPVIPVLQELNVPSSKQEYIVDDWDTYFYSDITNLSKVWTSSNTDTTAQLALKLFKFYFEEFDYTKHVIAPKQEERLKCTDKGWFRTINIEDPFNLDHNLGKQVSHKTFDIIKIVFRQAYLRYSLPPFNSAQVTTKHYLDAKYLLDGKAPPRNFICFRCHSRDHYISECPETKATVCSECNEKDHTKASCPRIRCFHCNQSGHITKDCPERQHNRDRRGAQYSPAKNFRKNEGMNSPNWRERNGRTNSINEPLNRRPSFNEDRPRTLSFTEHHQGGPAKQHSNDPERRNGQRKYSENTPKVYSERANSESDKVPIPAKPKPTKNKKKRASSESDKEHPPLPLPPQGLGIMPPLNTLPHLVSPPVIPPANILANPPGIPFVLATGFPQQPATNSVLVIKTKNEGAPVETPKPPVPKVPEVKEATHMNLLGNSVQIKMPAKAKENARQKQSKSSVRKELYGDERPKNVGVSRKLTKNIKPPTGGGGKKKMAKFEVFDPATVDEAEEGSRYGPKAENDGFGYGQYAPNPYEDSGYIVNNDPDDLSTWGDLTPSNRGDPIMGACNGVDLDQWDSYFKGNNDTAPKPSSKYSHPEHFGSPPKNTAGQILLKTLQEPKPSKKEAKWQPDNKDKSEKNEPRVKSEKIKNEKMKTEKMKNEVKCEKVEQKPEPSPRKKKQNQRPRSTHIEQPKYNPNPVSPTYESPQSYNPAQPYNAVPPPQYHQDNHYNNYNDYHNYDNDYSNYNDAPPPPPPPPTNGYCNYEREYSAPRTPQHQSSRGRNRARNRSESYPPPGFSEPARNSFIAQDPSYQPRSERSGTRRGRQGQEPKYQDRQPPHQASYHQGPPGLQGPPGFSTFDKGVEGPKGRGQRGRRY